MAISGWNGFGVCLFVCDQVLNDEKGPSVNIAVSYQRCMIIIHS